MTPLASDQLPSSTAEATAPDPWPGLVADPERLIDAPALAAAMDSAAAEAIAAGDRCAIRPAVVPLLRDALAEARAAIAAAIAGAPREAHRAIHDYAWMSGTIVRLVLDLGVRRMHVLPNPTSSEHIAAVAVGGFGRAEMAPFSDIDLLFLTPYKQTPWGESLIESVLYVLWDLRLKVGHSTRSIDDCLRLAKQDVSIRTSLLESRYLWGNQALAEALDSRLWSELFDSTGPQFVELKLEERNARHDRQGSSRYLLEPNVKEGKGGLRDLQTLYWIGKYLYHAGSTEDLVRVGVFTSEEYASLAAAEAFLWTTRVHLHLLNGRPVEQLTFDAQVDIAGMLGYRDDSAQRGVEQFMHDYFRHAKHVGDLTRIFLAALEARHVKSKPTFGEKLRTVFTFGRDPTGRGFTLKNGRLDMLDERAFETDPVNILRLFEESLAADIPIHPDALRRVAANLDLIDDGVRNDREANRIFLDLLLGHQNPERGLRLMNEVGVLGAFIPEFGRIVALMQFNMYHYYTVDEHTIRTISTLSTIERKELTGDLPIVSEIMARGVDRRVLYVALLLHDIGKGSGRDHSTVGAEVAETLCPRLGLEPQETELVVWLVQNHLLMSDVAQKRDLADPRTARDFARQVKSPTRLKFLTVLTVCDIRGVGPGVWNNWKAMLLRTLYNETIDVLTGGTQAPSRPEREAAAKAALGEALSDWSQSELEDECARHYAPYWLGFDTRTHAIFARLGRGLKDDSPEMEIELDANRDATQVCFAMADHPGIFARLAGALALAGANVVDARTYTTTDGVATAAFWIQDASGKPYEEARMARLRASVQGTMAGQIKAREALRDKDKIKKRERDFQVPTRISFDNSGSDIYTIIEVETRDRPGLLYDLARTLTANGISISSAIIATFGEQAVDAFYVKDLFGLKLYTESKRSQLEQRLRAAIAAAVPEPDRATR
ncbi:[protein-PII] uridylyltransferase [Amaricoccus macauensis]|uniref:[protein-PII] uridylyltransferase n=1 Tax=Amaricoccus macauensis TaxID=57001 RepID=UPI00160D9872|nr:[protein-PII] uridylyltransferase [Amaricoccus macauensis]